MHFTAFAIMTAITNFGDSAVLTAIVALGAPYLALCGQKREAGLLFLAFLLTAGLMTVLKMAVLVCYEKLPFPGLVSPSGHTAMTTAVLGVATLIIYRVAGSTLRGATIGLYVFLVLGVASTRVLLGFHSKSEVAVGLLVGAIVAVAIGSLLLRYPPSALNKRLRFRPGLMAGLIVICGVLVSGGKLPAEDMIDSIAWRLNDHIGLCR